MMAWETCYKHGEEMELLDTPYGTLLFCRKCDPRPFEKWENTKK